MAWQDTSRYYNIPKGLRIGWERAALRKKPENTKTCVICQKVYQRRGSRGRLSMTCSLACRAKFLRGRPSRKPIKNRIFVACEICQTVISTWKGAKQKPRFCSRACTGRYLSQYRRGSNHHRWKGNNCQGYRHVITTDGRRTLEHRLMLEQQLGRQLEVDEHVHHRNGNKLDNRLENLVILTPSEHTKLHMSHPCH